jgi:hypothetical protein
MWAETTMESAMSETNGAANALDGMKALHDEIERRLLTTSADYRALIALRKAMHEVKGTSIADSTRRTRVRLHRESESTGMSQADAAAAVLEDRGQPVPIANLVELVTQKGAPVGGKEPTINLSSTLSKDERFKSVRFNGRACWWFANRSLPSASK